MSLLVKVGTRKGTSTPDDDPEFPICLQPVPPARESLGRVGWGMGAG